MEIQPRRTNNFAQNGCRVVEYTDSRFNDESVHQRLDFLLALNAETAREKKMYRAEKEKLAAALMAHPLDFRQTYAKLGLLLGTLPPSAVFARFLLNSHIRPDEVWIIGLLAIVVLLTAMVAFQSGKFVGKIQRNIENENLPMMLFLTPLVGAFWGIISGGAGGLLIFGIGAIFGALIGGAVGAVTLPLFALFHRWIKSGDMIDRKHFLPIAFGVTFVLSALILGL